MVRFVAGSEFMMMSVLVKVDTDDHGMATNVWLSALPWSFLNTREPSEITGSRRAENPREWSQKQTKRRENCALWDGGRGERFRPHVADTLVPISPPNSDHVQLAGPI